jgi:uncharacterized protein
LWQMTKLPQEDELFTPTYESGGPGCRREASMYRDGGRVHGRTGFVLGHAPVPTDEIWHFYLGDAIELLLLHPDGRHELIILGTDVLGGQRAQVTVPSATWMGARLRPGGHSAIDGSNRVVFRQRRSRIVLSTLEHEVLSRHHFKNPERSATDYC